MAAWLQFGICTIMIFLAGPVLTREAHVIAPRWGLTHSWAGLVLLATATSLPELATGISAITAADAPNLAVGDVFGSCIFNLALLAFLDIKSREGTIYRHANEAHILSAALGILMIGVAGAALIIARDGMDLVVGHVSIYSPLLILVYLVAMRAIFLLSRVSTRERPEQSMELDRGSVGRLAGAALVIALAGSWLPFAGVEIAENMGWKTSFVGTALVAGATSLPELVVVLAALKLRSVDMAIAGLLGSNLFDLLILGIDDIAYTKGSLFASVSAAHAGSAFAAAIMGGIVIMSIVDRPTIRVFGRIGWASIFLIAVYMIAAYSIYLLGL